MPAPLQAQDAERLSLVKAGFIVRFPDFVDWPKGALHNPFTFCLADSSELTAPLRSVARHVRFAGSRPLVRELDRGELPTGCALLFIPGSRSGELDEILRPIRERAILTVGDTPGFAERGVQINLFQEGDKVGFEINRAAAARAGLDLSFRLLEMARLVEP
ncbi:MAG: YfiR family protein [Chromatiales bacterium]